MEQEKNIETVLRDVKGQALEVIFRHLSRENCVVFLFGSLAGVEGGRGADIDIGIVCDKRVDRGVLALIKDEIEEKAKTLRKIDVVDFNAAEDKEFLKVSLGRIRIWHQTPKSKTFLDNLKKRISG